MQPEKQASSSKGSTIGLALLFGVIGASVGSMPSEVEGFLLGVLFGALLAQVFHLRGRGLPRVNASGTGDLHVKVQLWTPQSVENEEEGLIKQLAALQGSAPPQREKSIWSKMKEALGA